VIRCDDEARLGAQRIERLEVQLEPSGAPQTAEIMRNTNMIPRCPSRGSDQSSGLTRDGSDGACRARHGYNVGEVKVSEAIGSCFAFGR
jgi:hypothetical protein